MTRPRAFVPAAAGGVFALLALAAGCRGRTTTAGKSAAEYDEAQRKGMTVGGGGHGHAQEGGESSPMPTGPQAMPGHGATKPQEEAAHAGHSGMERSAMAGMDRSRMDHARAPGRRGTGMAGMDHSRMAGAPAGHAAHGSPSAGGTPSHPPAHQPGAAMAGMEQSGMAHAPGMTMPPPTPERASATASPGQPAATLRPDAIDGAVSTSVTDAARSAAMAAEMAAGGHAMPHGTYTQTDAGRGSAAPAQPPGTGHEGHQAAPKPKPSPSPDPHHMHAPSPAPTPSPSPRVEEDHR